MTEVGSARLVSLECVTTGVGSVSRDARAKPNSLGRSLRLPLPEGTVSMTFWPKLLLTDNWKMPGNSGNDLHYDKCSVYHNTMLKTALPTGWRSNWRKPKPFQYIFLTNVHQQSTIAARARSKCARRTEFSRRDDFRDSNERRIHERYRKILHRSI